MKRFLIRLLLLSVAAWATESTAQTQADFDAFGITDDNKSLDEVVRDDGGAAPQPAPTSDEPPATTAQRPAEPAASEAAAASLSQEATPAVPPPADWTSFGISTATAYVPPDWALVEENDDSKLYFSGDMKTHAGVAFGMSLDREDRLIPPDATITSDTRVVLNGQPFRRIEIAFKLDPKTDAEMIALISARPIEGRDHLIVHGMAINVPLEAHRDEIERMLAGVQLAAAAPAAVRGTALGGLISYDLPDTWVVTGSDPDEQISFRPRLYSGYITFFRGRGLTKMHGADSDVPQGTASRKAIIFDQFADLFSWPVGSREFLVGTTLVGGRTDYYRLLECADGDPVGFKVSGAEEFFDGPDLAAAMAAITFNSPSALGPCATGHAAATQPQQPAETEQPGRTATAAAPELPQPRNETRQPGGREVSVEVGGVTFLLPEGWKATYDDPENKIFESPDGKWSVLSFWWFPDEPLLGYDDIKATENVIVDHEPVTRIFSTIAERHIIQNVTERARKDKKRFIFTLEGTNVPEAEATALHDWLVANLHLQGGFDPAKRVAPVPSGPVPGAAAVSPPSAPGPGIGQGVAPGRIDFSQGLQGWRGEHADLRAIPAGPDGAGALEAFCAGDGVNGYMMAPTSLLGDWSAIGGLRLALRTGTGTYVDPYAYGGRGDIYIESNGRSASIPFPVPVGSHWTAEELSFSSPDWRLKDAASIDDILSDVTAFHVRVEFLSGDATASISFIELVSADTATNSATPDAFAAMQGGWRSYVNDRFGTRIDYPADIFRALPAPENRDGRTFATRDERARFYVFGQFNYDNLDAGAMMARDRSLGDYGEVTYQRAGRDWYVLSGYNGGEIFYRKATLDPDTGIVHVFETIYSETDRDIFDPIVDRMANSLGHE